MSRYWSKFFYLKGGWVTLNENFRGKGASPTNDFWQQRSRVPGLSYGEKKLPKSLTALVGCTNVIDRRQTTDRRTADSTSAHQQMRDSEREPFYDYKTPSTGCGSECVSRCTSVYTTWHLHTCRHSANLCPAFLVAVTYAQLVVVNWTSPVSICPRTGDRRLPTPVLHPGTRCLTISRTLIFSFNLSNVILRHSSFPHTSTPQRV